MISKVPVWKEQREVESFDIDMNDRPKAHTVFSFLMNST